MSQNSGTLIGATVRPNDSTDTIAVAFAEEIRGGYVIASDRNALYTWATTYPARCNLYQTIGFIIDEDIELRLTNFNNRGSSGGWTEISGGGVSLWSSTKTYKKEQVVLYKVSATPDKYNFFVSLVDNNLNNTPGSDETKWNNPLAYVPTGFTTRSYMDVQDFINPSTTSTAFRITLIENVNNWFKRWVFRQSTPASSAGANTEYIIDLPTVSGVMALYHQIPSDIIAVLGNELDDIIAGNGKATLTIYRPCKIASVYIDLTTAATGSAVEFDIKKNGTTIFTTKPTIDAGELSSSTAAVATVLNAAVTTLALGDVLRFDITQAGAETAGKGPKVTILTSLP